MKKSKVEIVFLVAIYTEEKNDFLKVQNHIFRKKDDAINIIKKGYYLNATKNKNVWEQGGIKGILTELILLS